VSTREKRSDRKNKNKKSNAWDKKKQAETKLVDAVAQRHSRWKEDMLSDAEAKK